MKHMISMNVIYGLTALIAFLLVIGYWKILKNKVKWLSGLYAAVLAINTGYLLLSVSKTLQGALWANRLVYLASVFLPLTMFMIIIDVCQIVYKKKFVLIHIIISIIVFCLAGSGGFVDWYYKDVAITCINGATVLIKEYGPLHSLYGVYLLLYFVAMISLILYAMKKRKNIPYKVAVFLLVVVLGNMLVWFIEQLINTEFEFLSVSYIFTECLLLALYTILEDFSQHTVNKSEDSADMALEPVFEESCKEQSGDELKKSEEILEISENTIIAEVDSKEDMMNRVLQKINNTPLEGLENLSVREMEVLLLILDNRKRKSIAEEMEITENTVKKHTSHIFSKLGVASRKELFEKCKTAE